MPRLPPAGNLCDIVTNLAVHIFRSHEMHQNFFDSVLSPQPVCWAAPGWTPQRRESSRPVPVWLCIALCQDCQSQQCFDFPQRILLGSSAELSFPRGPASGSSCHRRSSPSFSVASVRKVETGLSSFRRQIPAPPSATSFKFALLCCESGTQAANARLRQGRTNSRHTPGKP